jgi:hypothetical protein
MTRRRLPIALVVLLASIAWAAPVSAGGWATATMDRPTPVPIAGIGSVFGFDIRQHGVTPVSWVTATFVATDLATGAQVQAPMHPEGADGRYAASITFPEAGDWTWYVALAELGTDQEGAGGTLAVVTPTQAAAAILAELGIPFLEPPDGVAVQGLRLVSEPAAVVTD